MRRISLQAAILGLAAGAASAQVHGGYTLSTVTFTNSIFTNGNGSRPLVGDMEVLPDGKVAVAEWGNPSSLFILSGFPATTGIQVKRFAKGLDNAGERSRHGQGQSDAGDGPRHDDARAFSQHQPQHLRALCAKGHSYPNLTRASGDRICGDAGQSHRSQDQAENAHPSVDDGRRPRQEQRLLDLLCHALHANYREVRID